MTNLSRRDLLALTASAAALAALPRATALAADGEGKGENIGFGLVTYQWGKDWDLPTLLANLQKTKLAGVELRTTHAHKVEPALNEKQRDDVRKQFADSGITLVGIGSDERFDSPDPEKLKKAIEATKEFIRLSHDIGGSGVKVKPDTFHKEVPQEKTIAQIGTALNELGEYAAGFGQQVRLEVHGKCAELPTIAAIMKIATDSNVAVCWNSNPTDLNGDGLEANFKLVRDRFGATCHVRELNDANYPFDKLFKLLVDSDYAGWILLEASSAPADRIVALTEQKALFDKLIAQAQG
ncbi:MAG TPA: TIM barrel protein [Pirellulaceae bacterium]|nr:TIM barrel protein [Pirellulaceae bacterium]